MIKLNVNGELEVKLPTSITEITPEILEKLTNRIIIGDERSLILLAGVIRLKDLAFNTDAKIATKLIKVIPVFVKSGKTNCDMIIGANRRDIVVMTPTAIEIGTHINVPGNKISNADVCKYLATDDTLRRNIATGKYFTENNIDKDTTIYTMDFKIVGNNDISAVFNSNIDIIDNPFVTKIVK